MKGRSDSKGEWGNIYHDETFCSLIMVITQLYIFCHLHNIDLKEWMMHWYDYVYYVKWKTKHFLNWSNKHLKNTINQRKLLNCSQFSSINQPCPTLCDPMNCSMPDLPVQHQLSEPTQTHVHWVRDAIQPPHPRSSPSPPALNLSQHQGLFKWVSSLH